MNSQILGLLAETSIHPGAGSDTGFVDLPVAREAATDYPVIVGSSVKGALRDHARNHKNDIDPDQVFGKQESGGDLVVSDARLLLLPVRSMTGHCKWVTCPHLVERYQRDLARSGSDAGAALPKVDPAKQHYLGAGDNKLFLEERQFTRGGDWPAGLVKAIKPLIRHETTQKRLDGQLVVLRDDDFAWFARFGLAVNARNALNDKTKTSENLWYEETLPPDALFYLLLAERRSDNDALDTTLGLFRETPYLQAGGNMTVGQGFFAVPPLETQGAPA